MSKEYFKELRIKFLNENRKGVEKFTDGSMSKKESLIFSKLIRNKIPYSTKVNKAVIIKSFKNLLKEIEFLELLESL